MASADAVTRVWEEKYRELERLFEKLRLELDKIKQERDDLAGKVSVWKDEEEKDKVRKKISGIK